MAFTPCSGHQALTKVLGILVLFVLMGQLQPALAYVVPGPDECITAPNACATCAEKYQFGSSVDLTIPSIPESVRKYWVANSCDATVCGELFVKYKLSAVSGVGHGVKGCVETKGITTWGTAYPQSAKNIYSYAACGRFCVAQSVRISCTTGPVKFAELSVFGLPDPKTGGTVGTNLATGKPVLVTPRISRGAPSGNGAALVDGDISTICSTPVPGVPGTITLNLGAPTAIHRISLYNTQVGGNEYNNGCVVALLDGANAVVKQWTPLTSKSGSTTFSDTGTNGWKKWYAKGGLKSALVGLDIN